MTLTTDSRIKEWCGFQSLDHLQVISTMKLKTVLKANVFPLFASLCISTPLLSGCIETDKSSSDSLSSIYESRIDEVVDCLYYFVKNSFQSDFDSEYYQTEVDSTIFDSLILKARMNTNESDANIFRFSISKSNAVSNLSMDVDIFRHRVLAFSLYGTFSKEDPLSTSFAADIDSSFSKGSSLVLEIDSSGNPVDTEELNEVVVDCLDSLFSTLNEFFLSNQLYISMSDFGLENY